jgi:hypothetical protein
MKKISLLLLVIGLFFAFACNQAEKNQDNVEVDEVEDIKEDVPEKLEIENSVDDEQENFDKKNNPKSETDDNIKEGKINISEIEKGNIIEGMEVSKFEYRKGDYYNIEFIGLKQIGGELTYNSFEDSWDIVVDEEYLPKTTIIADGEEYQFFTVLSVRNRDEFKKSLDGETLGMVENGENVWIKCYFENFVIGQNFDKGRYGVAFVDYTINK